MLPEDVRGFWIAGILFLTILCIGVLGQQFAN